MNWENILKNDNIKEGGKEIGPRDTHGAFTMDIKTFFGDTWQKLLHKLLSFNIIDDEKGEGRALSRVTQDAIGYAEEYYFDIMTALIEANPELKDVGTPTSKVVDGNIEKIIKDTHVRIDKYIERGEDDELKIGQQLKDSDSLPSELVDKVWDNVLKDYSKKVVADSVNALIDSLDIDGVDANILIGEVMNKESTKQFLTHVWILLSAKIKAGMSAFSSKGLERNIKDKMTPGEIAWMEKHSKDLKIDMGQMGTMDAGRSYPELDESTGIPKITQIDPETGEKYYIPRDIGAIDKPDFDPADEEEDGSNTPKVTEYNPDSGRMEEPAEWRQWREKNASEKLQTDSFERSWETLKKR